MRTRSRSRAITRALAALLCLALLGACADTPDETPTRAPSRPTRTPSAGARPTRTPAAPGPTAAPGTGAEWTIMVYLDGDNDLEPEAIGDFAEMASVGSSDAVNIVVQFDRVKSDEDWDSTAYGNWGGVKRFRVERGKRPVASNQLADLGELNMGDPQTVVDFVSWGITSYPARHYALIFWDHGASWPGVASDDSSDGDMLTLPELAGALAKVQKNTGVGRLDLIGFDACLMNQVDVLQAVAPYGKVAVGSADLEPGEGWAWNAWLADLAKAPPMGPEALAPSIISSFSSFYKEEGDSSVTLAAFDLDKVAQITGQLDALSAAMIDTMPQSYKAIAKARSFAAEYASGDTDISAVDLGSFADALAASAADPKVTAAAKLLGGTIKGARIAQGHGADHPRTAGISVYFPKKKRDYDSDYASGSPLTSATRWDDFLRAFYAPRRQASSPARSTKPRLSRPETPDAPTVSLDATIAGDDTAYVYYFVGAASPSDPGAVQIMTLDYIYPPGVTQAGDAPAWADGDPVQLAWNATAWYLSDGASVVPAPVAPTDYGTGTYSVDGTYTRRSGTKIPVSVEFTVAGGRGTLQHVWAFDKGSGDHPRPRELTPRAGDTFTPDIPVFREDGSGPEDETTPGEPIAFGDSPLVLFEGPAPAGSYTIGLMVEDTSGEVSDQYAETQLATGEAPAAAPAAAQAQPGQAGRFHDDARGFGLEYPAGWRPTSPGSDKVVFADPERPEAGSLSVDAYPFAGRAGDATAAAEASVLDAAGREPGFALTSPAADVRVARRAGRRLEYSYRRADGSTAHVAVAVVSDARAHVTYVITVEVPESSAGAGAAALDAALTSFAID